MSWLARFLLVLAGLFPLSCGADRGEYSAKLSALLPDAAEMPTEVVAAMGGQLVDGGAVRTDFSRGDANPVFRPGSSGLKFSKSFLGTGPETNSELDLRLRRFDSPEDAVDFWKTFPIATSYTRSALFSYMSDDERRRIAAEYRFETDLSVRSDGVCLTPQTTIESPPETCFGSAIWLAMCNWTMDIMYSPADGLPMGSPVVTEVAGSIVELMADKLKCKLPSR